VCPIPNPAPLTPVRIELRNPGLLIPTEIIAFPLGTSHVIQANINKTYADILSRIGFGADVAELISMIPQVPGIPDAVAVFDIAVTTGASYYSGETYLYQQPHPTLPPMTVIGQDVIFTSADAVGAALAKVVLPILGTGIGSSVSIPGGVMGVAAGYVGGQAVDVVATVASVVYDGARLAGMPTYFSYGILWDPRGPRQAILIHAQE
jgi:hypothetical protein